MQLPGVVALNTPYPAMDEVGGVRRVVDHEYLGSTRSSHEILSTYLGHKFKRLGAKHCSQFTRYTKPDFPQDITV